MGGIAVHGKQIVLGDRDLADLSDVIRCYAADTGQVLWEYAYPAPGELDYGQTPRSTPLIVGDAVIMQGAMGHVTALELATGRLRWQRDFAVEAPPVKRSEWGACSSPIPFGDWVIVNPGAKDMSLAALSLKDGAIAWKSPGTAAGHGSFILAKLGGVQQLVGFDSESLGGWDPRTGRRLWTLKPTIPGDFNVPTPLPIDGQLLIATENNGTRRYSFDNAGRIKAQPVAENQYLAPDMSSLVHSKGRVYCVWHELFCLDAGTLKQQWSTKHDKLQDYGACFATDNRLLVVGRGGHLLLLDTTASQAKLLGELDVLPDDDAENYSHPALVGNRLYLRGGKRLVCVALQ
ncbi:MAG: PQQ-like beta-propeller repeat protein [Planctomycetales bacterium]|nr:PQQ-like beta-propeller repeat protein [Planctomycetales bacterium]